MGITRRLVPKSDSSTRLCVDYRRLNKVTKSDPFPMPQVDELIKKHNYMSTLDLTHGYYQIPVHSDSIPKTSFVTPFGKWEFVVMPFGLKGALSVFQIFMNTTLAEMLEYSASYIDDIILYSTTFKEHLQHLEIVFRLTNP